MPKKSKFFLMGSAKGENAGYQDFLLFPVCFKMTFFQASLKRELGGKGLLQRDPAWLSGNVFDSQSRAPGSNCIGSSGFFMGVSLGKTIQSPNIILAKRKKDINNVSCRLDMRDTI